MSGGSRRNRALWAVAIAVALVGLLGASGAVTGSDTISVFQYEPSEFEAEQGETVTVGVELFAGGASHDIGVDRVEIEVRYDAEALTLQEVERGEWLERGEETTVEMDVDDSPGEVTIRQVRDPARGGVTGTATFAELTFEIDTEAEPGEYTLWYGDGAVQMVNDHYQPVFTHNATLTVLEGESVGDEGPDAESGESDAESGGPDDDSGEPDDEIGGADGETPLGFGFVVAGLGVLALVGVLFARRVLG